MEDHHRCRQEVGKRKRCRCKENVTLESNTGLACRFSTNTQEGNTPIVASSTVVACHVT